MPSEANKKSFPRGAPMQHLAPRQNPDLSNGYLMALDSDAYFTFPENTAQEVWVVGSACRLIASPPPFVLRQEPPWALGASPVEEVRCAGVGNIATKRFGTGEGFT